MEDGTGGGVDDFDADGFGGTTAADEEAGPWVGDGEGIGGQGAGGGVGEGEFVGADPPISCVAAVLAAAAGGDGVVLDGLASEGVAGGGPVGERARFEVEREWLAGRGGREEGGRVGGLRGRVGWNGWEIRVAEIGEEDVAELDGGGAGARVELEPEETGGSGDVGLVVVECAEEDVIDPDLDVGAGGADAVAVPRVGGGDGAEGVWGGEGIGPAAAVWGDGDAGAAFHEEGAAVFVVDSAEPLGAVVEVALEAAGGVVGETFRADLDAAVGGGVAGDSVFEGELEVVERLVEPEPLVVIEGVAGFYLGGDGAVFDRPDAGVSLPAVERLAVEDGGWGGVGGGGKSGERDEGADRAEGGEVHGGGESRNGVRAIRLSPAAARGRRSFGGRVSLSGRCGGRRRRDGTSRGPGRRRGSILRLRRASGVPCWRCRRGTRGGRGSRRSRGLQRRGHW